MPDAKDIVLNKIDEEHEVFPTELLERLRDALSYRQIQDAIRELLESGKVELGSDRRLRAVARAA